MNSVESNIYKEVKSRCLSPNNIYGIGVWDYHIKLVYELAKNNAKSYGADIEVVALAALLHDIASITNKDFAEEHHIIGATMAEELLMEENYPKDKIGLIQKCILNHRGSKLMDKNTPEEVCIADADAMAHFYNVPSLLSMVYREKKLSIDEGAQFVKNKLNRSYNKLSSKGKMLVAQQYEAAKVLLK